MSLRSYGVICAQAIFVDSSQGTVTTTAGHLIYFNNDHRVQRQNYFLEGTRPVVLRNGSSKAIPRAKSHLRVSDVWLGGDPGPGADRQDRVSDFPVSQRWSLPCAHKSKCPKSRKP